MLYSVFVCVSLLQECALGIGYSLSLSLCVMSVGIHILFALYAALSRHILVETSSQKHQKQNRLMLFLRAPKAQTILCFLFSGLLIASTCRFCRRRRRLKYTRLDFALYRNARAHAILRFSFAHVLPCVPCAGVLHKHTQSHTHFQSM